MTTELAVLMQVGCSTRMGAIRGWAKKPMSARSSNPIIDLLKDVLTRGRGTLQSETPTECQVSFKSANAAVLAALEMHHTLRGLAGKATAPATAIGIHAGQIVLFGGMDESHTLPTGPMVDECRRLTALAGPGQTLLTRTASDIARPYVREDPFSTAAPPPALVRSRALPDSWARPKRSKSARWGSRVKRRSPRRRNRTASGEPTPLRRRRRWAGGPPSSKGPAPTGLDHPGEARRRGLRRGLGRPPREDPRTTGLQVVFDTQRLSSFKRELTLFRLLRKALGDRLNIARLLEVELDERLTTWKVSMSRGATSASGARPMAASRRCRWRNGSG